jgi:hypothetical protein
MTQVEYFRLATYRQEENYENDVNKQLTLSIGSNHASLMFSRLMVQNRSILTHSWSRRVKLIIVKPSNTVWSSIIPSNDRLPE